jgi:hypothetical protein
MNNSTAKNSSSTLRIAVAVAILAGAGLSGCATPYDPYLDTPRYSQGYNQPVYPSQRYYDTNAQGNYYDPNNPNRPYYPNGPVYYQPR